MATFYFIFYFVVIPFIGLAVSIYMASRPWYKCMAEREKLLERFNQLYPSK